MTVSTINPTLSPYIEDFVRGSDMIKIMTGEWNELWRIKKGLQGRPDLSFQFNVQLGLATEDFNIKWAEDNYMLKFNKQAARQMQYGLIKLTGTLDGFSAKNADDEVEFIGIECKHTYSYNTMDKMLEYYMPQLQFYIWIAKLEKMIFSVIFGNQWKAVEVYPSEEYLELMKENIKMFWDHIVHNTEPDDNNYHNDVLKRNASAYIDSVPINKMTARDASKSNSFTEYTQQYLQHEDAAKSFEVARKALREEIRPNEREVYNDLISVKRDKRGSVRITKKG
jgi:hypothetical protein